MSKVCLYIIFLFFLNACGASIKIYPLVGDDKEVVEKFCYKPKLDKSDPQSAVLLEFKDACLKNDYKKVWSMLSERSKKLLDNLGKILNLSGFFCLKNGVLPSFESSNKKIKFTLKSLFFFDNDFVIEKVLSAPDRGIFLVVNKDNLAKELMVIRGKNGYKIHIKDIKSLTMED